MTDEATNQLRSGSVFPSTSSATLCFIKQKPISNTELNYIKREILKYLGTHDGAYISDLSRIINVEPKKIVLAIRELKEEDLLI